MKKNHTIQVTRTGESAAKQALPEWVNRRMVNLNQEVLPDCYDLQDLKKSLHSVQENQGSIQGYVILKYLEESGNLNKSLDFPDLEAIKGLGVDSFREIFQDNSLVFWQTAVEGRLDAFGGSLECPPLFVKVMEVRYQELFHYWKPLTEVFNRKYPIYTLEKE